ncbi:MAG: DUF4185 domain-containing protein [Mycobacterium sp.]
MVSTRKSAASHIGRIGGLAVALGVGAAVVSGTAVAWAEAPDAGTSSSSDHPSNTRATRGPAAATTGTRTSADGPATARASSPRTPGPAAAAKKPSASSTIAPNDNAGLPAALTTEETGAQPVSDPAPPVSAPVDVVIAEPVIHVPVAQAETVSAPVAATLAEPAGAATPIAVAAPRPTRAVAGLLSTASVGPAAASTTTGNLLDSPALWALMAASRGEIGRVGRRGAASVAPSATVGTADVSASAIAGATSLPSTPIGWVTGQRNNLLPGSTWTQTNNTRWAGVYGTDLGIMWYNPENQGGRVQLAFGDTFSQVNMTGDWRSNVLLISNDKQLYNGLSLEDTGYAYQFIPAARNQVFFIGSEVTNIPTSAVYANANNYVSYMSVKSWDTPGRWTTNYSAISQYNPATDKWVLQTSTVRSAGWFRSSQPYRAGDQNFQQMAYVLEPESKVAPGATRYVYAFGTPAGRAGSAFLSRVPEGSITDLSQYDYWDGSTWVKDRPAVAAPVIGDSTSSTGLFGCIIDLANNPNFFGGWFAGLTGAKTGGNVSEMSIQYNEYLDKYVMLYGNGQNNVILRTADTPEGTWSDPVTIATSIRYPGLYAPMIHPLSGTGDLTDANGDPDITNLYWNMSIWNNYNVVLMQTDLSALQPASA